MFAVYVVAQQSVIWSYFTVALIVCAALIVPVQNRWVRRLVTVAGLGVAGLGLIFVYWGYWPSWAVGYLW